MYGHHPARRPAEPRHHLTAAADKPRKPLATSHIDTILKNRYYVGVVVFEGVEYPGQHEALIDEHLYHQVQSVRAGRVQSQEKPRVRTHYLKGSIYCGQCGEPFSYAASRNRQGKLYYYFYCRGRQSLKNGCDQRAVPVDLAEDLVEQHWRTITLSRKHAEKIGQLVRDYIATVLPTYHHRTEEAQRQLKRLDEQARKALQAHYADAIPMDVLQEEQARIAVEKAGAQRILKQYQVHEEHIHEQVNRWVALIQQADRHYRAADPAIRRQLNQGVFEKIWLDDDRVVGSDLTPAFRRLLSDSLSEDLTAETAQEQKRRVRTRDLWVVPGPVPDLTESDLAIPRDQARRDRRHTVHAPLTAYLRREPAARPVALGRKEPRSV